MISTTFNLIEPMFCVNYCGCFAEKKNAKGERTFNLMEISDFFFLTTETRGLMKSVKNINCGRKNQVQSIASSIQY